MKETVTLERFCESFTSIPSNNFSSEGMKALFSHLNDFEEQSGDEIELDPIALCCEYTEYDSAYDAMEQYQPEDMPVEGEDGDDLLEVQEKNEKEALSWLQDRTTVIEVEGGKVIIQNF
jgi:hypothetical protein